MERIQPSREAEAQMISEHYYTKLWEGFFV